MLEKILENVINEMAPHLDPEQQEHLSNVLYPVYTYKDVTGTVMIAEFRLPDLREAYKSLEEEVTNTQMALVELYEGGEV